LAAPARQVLTALVVRETIFEGAAAEGPDDERAARSKNQWFFSVIKGAALTFAGILDA